VFLRRLQTVLDDACLIPDHQFGFRRSHSTPEQCHRIVAKILDSLERKHYCCAVFLDVKQAFDRVWHPGLKAKLKRNLPQQYYDFLNSYLTDRKFRVRSGNATSEYRPIEAGVPQGSVLGPILYILQDSNASWTSSTRGFEGGTSPSTMRSRAKRSL
ncbi:hypothetical protein KR026_003205, partial [Drosophila bipectinata]